MIKKGDKVKVLVGSMNRNTIWTVLEAFTNEWMGEKIKEYTITDGITKTTLTEDVIVKA